MTDHQFSRFEAAATKHGRFWRATAQETAESIRLRLKSARQVTRIWKEITNDAEFDCQDNSDEETTSDDVEEFHSSSSQISLSP